MIYKISPFELLQAQVAVLLAIGLQVLVWRTNHELLAGPQFLIISVELALIVLISLLRSLTSRHQKAVNHFVASILLGLLSAANLSSLILVLNSLIFGHTGATGLELLTSAIAIFLTNIIVFALWYWEIDSPGLTQTRWSKHDKDFQFTQQDLGKDFPNWKPEFFDYFYLSVTNAINFAAADTKPLTRQAKLLMSIQALISVFTLALVITRAVSILS